MINNFAARCYFADYLELNNILDFAIHFAQGKELTDKLLTDSLDLYKSGDVSAKKSTEETIMNTSYHEMGHYLLHRLFGKKPPFVTIVARGNYGGYTLSEISDINEDYTKKYILDRICVSFGGRAAEVIHAGEENGINVGISSDIESATNNALYMVTCVGMGSESLAVMPNFEKAMDNPVIFNEVNKILKEQYDRAIRLLTLNLKNLDKLSQALYEKQSLIGDECEEIVPDSELVYE